MRKKPQSNPETSNCYRLLHVGDVFELKKGMDFYTLVPAKFVYDNTPFASNLVETNLVAGEVRTRNDGISKKAIVKQLIKTAHDYSDFDGIKFNEAKMEEAIVLPSMSRIHFDTSSYLGEYVVVEAKSQGGGTGMGPHDIYPDGWHIVARQLNNGKYNPNGKRITFYQTGAFTAMNEFVSVVRTMAMDFK